MSSSEASPEQNDAKALQEGKPAVTISKNLEVRARVLIARDTTISIANVSSISIVPIIHPKPNLWPIAVVIVIVTLILAGLIPAPNPYAQGTDPRGVVLGIGLLIAACVGLFSIQEQSPEWRLLISSNDRSLHYFTSDSREFLEKVRQLLTDKIDAADTKPSSVSINFANGNIQVVKEGGILVNGDGNQIATSGARLGSIEVAQSPGAQIGNGNSAIGNVYNVDYSQHLPTVERWREHFQARGYAELTSRLSELEALMRSGTPELQSRQRVHSLSEEIIRLLNNAAEAINVFGAIARAAGF